MEGLKPSEGHQQCGTGTLNFTWPKPNVERFGLERRWQVLFSLLILCCEPLKCVSPSLQYQSHDCKTHGRDQEHRAVLLPGGVSLVLPLPCA